MTPRTPHTGRLRRPETLGALGALLCFTGACASPGEEAVTCADDSTACLGEVQLTYLNVRYDLEQPVFINNRIPVAFGITSSSVDPDAPATQNVAVSFSFVEANPEDPAEPIECGSNAFDLELTGDGTEQLFSGFIWPTTLCEALVGRQVNLRVDFDGGEEAEATTHFESVVFSAANTDAPANLACRKVEDAGAADLGRGCVYEIDLRLTPSDPTGTLIDVRYPSLTPASSVAVLPYIDPTAVDAEIPPSLTVETTLVVNGRDPYLSGVAPEEVPPGLEEIAPGITEDLQFGVSPDQLDSIVALPGRATLRYEIAPEGDFGFRPLAIADASSEVRGATVDEVVIESLLPGTPNLFSHDLFALGATRFALGPGGEWESVSNFQVRGCFEAEFNQQGNQGDGSHDDCVTVPVVLVRETPNASSATAFGFNREFSRTVGSRGRIGLTAALSSENRLDRNGVFSRIEGNVDIVGKLGRSFSISVAHAHGEASLDMVAREASYDVGVEAFGQSILSVSESDPNLTHEEGFSTAKSHSFPGLGFGFGPVRVGFRFSLGGEITLDTSDHLTLETNPAACQAMLETTDSVEVCGSIGRTITPGFAFTASIEGGINLRLVKAGVRADLRIVNTDFPLDASLVWGLGADGPMVRGSVHWELGLQMIRGDVAIVGRVGFRRFSRSLRVNLFSFQSPRTSLTLLDRSLDVLEVLQ